MHIAQIGTGRVGRSTAYTIMCEGLPDTLTLCDIEPGLAEAFAEELQHVTASLGIDVEINSFDRNEDVSGADIILISAGKPREPGVKMSRRDLAIENGRIVRYVADTTRMRNPGAKYVVITNPVDSMGMICKRYSKAKFVISTGTNLESLRFRSNIAQTLRVPVLKVLGWVGGEHGDAAIPLWSTVRVNGLQIDDYLKSTNASIDRNLVNTYVKTVSKLIVDKIGGTEYGPAASFRDITRAMIKNSMEVLSVATPMKIEGIQELVLVSVPLQLGKNLGPTLYTDLDEDEQRDITKAARAIFQTYQTTLESIEENE